MKDDKTPRLGKFFLLTGLILLILFAASMKVGDINLLFLVFGSMALFLAYILIRAAAPTETTRFTTFRKARNSIHKRREEKKAKEEKKKNRGKPLLMDQKRDNGS